MNSMTVNSAPSTTTTTATAAAAATFITSRPQGGKNKEKLPGHIFGRVYATENRSFYVELPHGSSRIAGGIISLFVSESEGEILAAVSSSSPCFKAQKGTEKQGWVEYKIPRGCDVWEVAAYIANSPTLPGAIGEADLPVSQAVRRLYPKGFRPVRTDRLTPASAYRHAEQDLSLIEAHGPMGKELRRKVRDLLHYMWSALAAENMAEGLTQVFTLGRSPRKKKEWRHNAPPREDYW